MDNYILLQDDQNSFSAIKLLVGDNLQLHKFIFSNGIKIHAENKITVRNGLINTCYLHITIIRPSGSWLYYREQKGGNFKLIQSGNK